MRILIIKLGAIGDVLRTTSILQGLKDKYSGCSIDWITKKGSADMLKGNKFIDNVFLIDGLKDGIKGKGYDLVISLDDEDEACRIATDIGKKKRMKSLKGILKYSYFIVIASALYFFFS